jgi:glycosyltransferase involved in cell wall biosynthesis
VKILLIHNKYQQPGGEDVVFEQERNLLEDSGHQVATYCRTNDDVQDSSLLQKIQLAKNTVSNEESRRQILQLLKRDRFDLVHVHNTFMMISPSIYAACREANVPVVQTLHNYRLLCPGANFYRDGHTCEDCMSEGLWEGVRHGCYRGSRAATATVAAMVKVHRRRGTWNTAIDRYIALSEFARRKFVEGGLPAEKISVKPNFVHPDPGERDDTTGGYAAYVGRLSSEKGPATLIGGWKLLGNKIPLVIVGDGPMRPGLEKEAQSAGLTDITFHGRVSRAEVQAVMKGARFVVIPSECYENFPMGMTEAFSCGVPVVASRLGALQELVAEGRTGLLFQAGSPQELAAKAEWAWNHPEQMAVMGKAARKEFDNRYTAKQNYTMLMDIYNRTIAAQREAYA